jgi:hypothetical protein
MDAELPGPRDLELAAKKADHGLTSAEAYEMQGLAEVLDREIEAAMAPRLCEREGHDDEPIRPFTVRCMRCGRIA